MGKMAVVSGYSTVDYPTRLGVALQGAQTASVEALADDEWPRVGGAALYASRRIAAAGHRVAAFVTVGQDSNSACYAGVCREAGIDVEPFGAPARVRTPWCMLLYHDNGGHTCLIDRGGTEHCTLSDSQRKFLLRADIVCIAAGPAEATATLLERIPAGVPVAWIAKRDCVSFPDWLSRRLACRADIIFCNASERPMVDAARQHQVVHKQSVIETRGAEGVLLQHEECEVLLPCEPVMVRDATGAGDTLAGEVLATLLSAREVDLKAAVQRGIQAARELLLTRDPRNAG